MKKFLNKLASPAFSVKTGVEDNLEESRRKSGGGFTFGGLTATRMSPNANDSISASIWPADFQKMTTTGQSISPISGRTVDLYAIDLSSNRDKLFTKLHKACWTGDLEKVRKAIKKTDVNDVDSEMRTPLHLAAARAHKDIIWFLLGSKAKPNLPDRQGNTPLLKAVQCHRIDIVQFFLDRGADPKAANLAGVTGLHMAAQDGMQEVAGALIRSGASVNAMDQNGCTPLHMAAMKQQVDLAKTLLRHGASVDKTDRNQRTCLMLACDRGSTELVQLFLDYGAKVALASSQGLTAEDFARRSGHNACLKLLSTTQNTSVALPIVDHSPDFKSVDLDSWNDDDDEISRSGKNAVQSQTGFDLRKFNDKADHESLNGSSDSMLLDAKTPLRSLPIAENVNAVPRSETISAIQSPQLELPIGSPPTKPKRLSSSMEPDIATVANSDNIQNMLPASSLTASNSAKENANKRASELMAELGLSDVSHFSSSDLSSAKDDDSLHGLAIDSDAHDKDVNDDQKPLEIELSAFIGPFPLNEVSENPPKSAEPMEVTIEATISPILSDNLPFESDLEAELFREGSSDFLDSDSSMAELLPQQNCIDQKPEVPHINEVDDSESLKLALSVQSRADSTNCLEKVIEASSKGLITISKPVIPLPDGTLGRIDTLQGVEEIWLRNPCRAIPIDLGSLASSSSSDNHQSSNVTSSTMPDNNNNDNSTASVGITGVFHAELAKDKSKDEIPIPVLLTTAPSNDVAIVRTKSEDWDKLWLRICGNLPTELGSDSIDDSSILDVDRMTSKNSNLLLNAAVDVPINDVHKQITLLEQISSPDDQSSLSLNEDQTYRLLVSTALVDPTPVTAVHRMASMVQHLHRSWVSEQTLRRSVEDQISALAVSEKVTKEKSDEISSALNEQKSKVAELERDLEAVQLSLDAETRRTSDALLELDKRREQMNVVEAKYIHESSERQKANLRARAAELQTENLQLMLVNEAAQLKPKTSELDVLNLEIGILKEQIERITSEQNSVLQERDEIKSVCAEYQSSERSLVEQNANLAHTIEQLQSEIKMTSNRETAIRRELDATNHRFEIIRNSNVDLEERNAELNVVLRERITEIGNVRLELAQCNDNLKIAEDRANNVARISSESESTMRNEITRLGEELKLSEENRVELLTQFADAKARREQIQAILEDERAELRNAQELIRSLEHELKKMTRGAIAAATDEINVNDGILQSESKNVRPKVKYNEDTGESARLSKEIKASKNFTEFDLSPSNEQVDGENDTDIVDAHSDSRKTDFLHHHHHHRAGVFCPAHSHSSWYKLRDDGSIEDEIVIKDHQQDPIRSSVSGAASASVKHYNNLKAAFQSEIDHSNCIDRSELDIMREQIELNARNEMNKKLEQINNILEERTKPASRTNMNLDRSNSQLRGTEYPLAIHALQNEISRLHRSLEWSESRHTLLEQHCSRLCDLIQAKRRVKSKLRQRTSETDAVTASVLVNSTNKTTMDEVDERTCPSNSMHRGLPIYDFKKISVDDKMRVDGSRFLSSTANFSNTYFNNNLKNDTIGHRSVKPNSFKFALPDFTERHSEPCFQMHQPFSVDFEPTKSIKTTSGSTLKTPLKRKFI